MARLWHILFLGCFPASLVLVAGGAWPAGIILLLVGTPLFWTLRNREMGRVRNPAIRPARDVPPELRYVSPMDASDKEVQEGLEHGIIHPQANYALVYKLAFEPQLEPGERPIGDNVLRPAFITSGKNIVPKLPTSDDMAWLFVTTAGIRWHYPEEGVVDGPRSEEATSRAGPRFVPYGDLTLASGGITETLGHGPFGPVRVHVRAAHHEIDTEKWEHLFGLADGNDTTDLFDEVAARAERDQQGKRP